MAIPFDELVQGAFVRRLSRFSAEVQVEGLLSLAFLPNSGRLKELLTPDCPVWLTPQEKPGRKTLYDLKLVKHQGTLVSIDARLPPHILADQLQNLPLFEGYQLLCKEPSTPSGRLDLLLDSPSGYWWIETKSVTLVEEGIALFPDAPSSRGSRHLQELIRLRQAGHRTAIIFIIQRPNAQVFQPHPSADPFFSQTLSKAAEAGVEVYAWNCQVNLKGIQLAQQVPVILP